jgi:hypothetical protein
MNQDYFVHPVVYLLLELEMVLVKWELYLAILDSIQKSCSLYLVKNV